MWTQDPRAVSVTQVRGEPLDPALDDHVSQGLSTPTASAAHGLLTMNPCTRTRPVPQGALQGAGGGGAARREGAFRREQGSPARQSARQGGHACRWLRFRLLEVWNQKETINRGTCSSVPQDAWGRAVSPGSWALGAPNLQAAPHLSLLSDGAPCAVSNQRPPASAPRTSSHSQAPCTATWHPAREGSAARARPQVAPPSPGEARTQGRGRK